jgi:hypothetical protein
MRKLRGFNRVRLAGLFVGLLMLVCLVAAPSTSAQTFNVTITGGSGGGCSSGNTGTLTIGPGNSLEFTSTGGCYFGKVGFDAGASTCTSSNCSTLSEILANTEYVFMNSGSTSTATNAGGCQTSSNCSANAANDNFVVYFNDAAACGSTGGHANSCIELGSTNNSGKAFDVDFMIVTPEPASFLLFGSGLLVLGMVLRKKLGLGRSA